MKAKLPYCTPNLHVVYYTTCKLDGETGLMRNQNGCEDSLIRRRL